MNRWLRIGLEGLAVILLALVIVQFFTPNRNTITATETPVDINSPVGRVRFDDANYYVDKAEINLTKVQPPASGKHYEVWFKGPDGTVRDLGEITFAATGSGRLEVTEPDSKNFLSTFNQMLITLEEDGANVTKPAGEVLYSSVLPPKSLVEMKKVLVSYDELPDKGPLMQNLWWYNASYINRSINGDEFDQNYKEGIVQAYQSQDEATLRKKTEEVINAIVGEQSNQYQDYNKDGNIDNAGDGFGSLQNGSSPGYIQATILNATNAANAADSTPNIRLNSENVKICLTNVTGWTEQILNLALQLNNTPFGPEMDPIVKQISSLGKTLLKGQDANKNGQYDEAISGECGATGGYYYGYYMADMFIYPGADRVPPPEK